jgi:hypothetical protein
VSPVAIKASLLRARHAFGSAQLDADNRRFRTVDLKSSKGQLYNSITAPENFFWLTNVYVELAIIIAVLPVLAKEARFAFIPLPAMPERRHRRYPLEGRGLRGLGQGHSGRDREGALQIHLNGYETTCHHV